MQTAYLDHRDLQIGFEGGTIVLRDQDGQRLGTLPARNIERLILQGEMLCSTGAMRHLLEQGTSIVWLSARKSHPVASLHGGLHGDARIRLQQYQSYTNEAFRLRFARRVVLSKLQGQQHQISQWLHGTGSRHRILLQAQTDIAGAIEALEAATTIDAIMGHEGQSAHAYFRVLFAQIPQAVSSQARTRRPPQDPINAILSLAYTLTHHEAVSACYAVGLDPYIGFLHEVSVGRESMACDLNEFLRQTVDAFAVHIFREEILRKEHFSKEADAGCILGKAGRAHFYRGWAQVAPTVRRMARRYARWAVGIVREQGVPPS